MSQLKSFFGGWLNSAAGRRLKWTSATLCLGYLAVVVFFAWRCSEFYLPGKGFTYLIGFGDLSNANYLPELKAVNHFEQSKLAGYDGQYYAQIAMRPHLDDPVLRKAVDNLVYRGRRILFCWTAYALAGGNPVRALHIYAVQNIVAWFLLALLLLRWFPPVNWGNWFRWVCVLFSFGMCECVVTATVDGPSLLLIAAGVALVELRRPWLAAVVFGISGLGKDTNVLSAGALAPGRNSASEWLKAVFRGLLVVLPLAVWILVLSRWLGNSNLIDDTLGARNFSHIPFAGYATKWREIVRYVATKPGWIGWGGVVIQVALTVQCLFLALSPRPSSPWWRIGAAYAVLMAFLGDAVWEGYPGASARVLLPLTLVFNVLVPRAKAWWIVLLLGNLSVLVSYQPLNPPGRESFVVEGPRDLRMVPGTGHIVEAVFDANWERPEKSWFEFFRWSHGSAGLIIRNPHPFALESRITLVLRSNDRRTVRLTQAGRLLWEGSLEPRIPHPVELANVVLPPGDTPWRFETGAGVRPDNPGDLRLLGFSIRNLTIKLVGRAGQ